MAGIQDEIPICCVWFQVAGRNVILFVIFGGLEEMQTKAVVFFVFYLWSTIEIFRSAPVGPRLLCQWMCVVV